MSKFIVTETPVPGVLVIEPQVVESKRGFRMESYSERDFVEMGIEAHFVQEIHEMAPRGVLRGLHFQRENPQGLLLHVVSGGLLAVAVDLRAESKSYGASHAVELSDENRRMLWIPPQFAFGLLTLDRETEWVVKSTTYEDAATTSGVVWNDPILAIDWQFERYDIDEKYLNISDKDKKLPVFRSWNPKTLWKK